jgi:hypothetical protein
LVLERRNGSPNLTARTYLNGRVLTKNTGESAPNAARKIATEWFLDKLAEERAGIIPPLPAKKSKGVLFETAYESFIAYADREKEVSSLQGATTDTSFRFSSRISTASRSRKST